MVPRFTSCLQGVSTVYLSEWPPAVNRTRTFTFTIAIILAIAAGLAASMHVRADTPIVLDVMVQSSESNGTVDFGDISYTEAVQAFEDADTGSAALPVGPTGMPSISVDDAEMHRSDASASVAFLGTTTLLGVEADVLVTAKWDDMDTDTDADTAVLVSFGAVELGDITDFEQFPLALTDSWIALAPAEHTVDPAQFDADVAGFFDDGLAGTEDAFDVTGAGIAFRGVIDASDTVIGDAANEIGLSGQVRLTGTLTTDLGILEGSGDASAGLALSAEFELNPGGGNLPDWFQPTANWQLEIALNSEGSVSASLSGAANIHIGETSFAVNASVAFSYDGGTGEAVFSFSGDVEQTPDLFGQTWLDLETIDLTLSFSTVDGFSGGLAATLDLNDLLQQDATADVTLLFAAGSGGSEGSLEVTTDASLSLSDLIDGFRGPGHAAFADDAFDATVSGFSLFVGFSESGGSTEVSVSATTNLNFDINDATISSDVLFKLRAGGAATSQFLFAIKPDNPETGVMVGDLLGENLGDLDFELPRFTLTIANEGWDETAADQDGPTSIYTGGQDLDVPSGVTLRADVAITGELKAALEELGLTVEGDLVLLGTFDPFTAAGDVNLSVSLPKLSSPPFKDATLSLVLGLSASGRVEVGVEGEVIVAVPRTEDPDCAGDTTAEGCVDELEFELAATLTAEAGNVRFTLAGGLTSTSPAGWFEPLGVQGLTIFELRLEVGVQSTPPAVTLGMLGRLNVNGTDVTVSFLLGLSANPPFIDPQGFTFAASSLDIFDLAELHRVTSKNGGASDQQIQDNLPPNLRLEAVFVAFGRVQSTSLCIRPGFFLTAELHVGGQAPGPLPGQGDPDADVEPPPCEPPPLTPPEVTDNCEFDPDESCIAAIRFDVDTGVVTGTPALRATGFFRGTELGPLTFEPLTIELELSAQTQRFFVSGSAKLEDPIDSSNAEWASGGFTVEFSSERLFLEAHMSLADGEVLRIYIRGEAVLDFGSPVFELEIEFRSGLLDELADEIDQGFNDLANAVDRFSRRLSDAESTDATLWRNLERQLRADGAPQWLIDMTNTFADVEATLEEINRTFTDAGLPPPIVSETIQEIVLQGVTIGGFPGIELGYVHGTICLVPDFAGGCAVEIEVDPPLCFGFEQGGKCWVIPPGEPWVIGGLCDDTNFNPGEPYEGLLCGTDPAGREIVGALFAEELEDDLNLVLPDDTPGLEILNTLDEKFDGSGLFGTCGFVTADYGEGTLSDTELTLQVHGEPVVIVAPLNLQGDAFDEYNETLQLSLDALLGVNNPKTDFCDETFTSAPDSAEASIALDVAPEALNEGEQVTAEGTVADSDEVTVAISWGDGTNTTVDIEADGSFSATHTYTDDIGEGAFATYTVRAAAGTISQTARVTVHNVAPAFTRLEFTPDTINEGDTATLEVEFSDPGSDSHTVATTWSDGFTETVTLPTGARSHTFTHTIQDDNPTATPSDLLGATVTILDDDDGRVSGSTNVTVDNVAPGEVAVEADRVIVGEGATDADGNLVVNEGDVVAWRISFRDVGVRDWHVVTIDWGDGSPVETRTLPANGQETSSFITVHAFADDPPSGTPAGSYDVTVTVADDDSGTATEVVPVTVNNVAPTIEALSLSTETHDENEMDVMIDLDFSDPGLLDTHTVTIDWGDGWSAGESDGTDADDADRKLTIIDIPAGSDGRSGISATNRYGDNGVYTITVTIVDDDTGEVTDTRTLTVGSVAPTHAINDSAADGAVASPAGEQVFIAAAGDDVVITNTATDPGSDDLFFEWAFGDGNGASNSHLVEVPGAGDDPTPSPQVAARDVTDGIVHDYGSACLYGVSVQVTDDDGANGGVDHVAVVIQEASADFDQRNFGQWGAAIRRGEVSQEQLDCYLDIAGYLSSVLVGQSELAGEAWAPLVGTEDLTVNDHQGIPAVLTRPPGPGPDVLRNEQIKLERDLLAQWLNFAAGVWQWGSLVEDADGDGVLDTTFSEVLHEVEQVRRDSASPHEVRQARQRLWPLGAPSTPPTGGSPGRGR